MPRTRTAPDTGRFLSTREAAEQLGVKPQTLYSYVSRGVLQSVPEAGSTRSLFEREAVQALAQQRGRGRGPAPSPGPAARAERPSEILPALASAVTQITPRGPRYRDHDFRELAQYPGQFENVAELLWSGVLLDEPLTWEADVVPQNLEPTLRALHGGGHYVPVLRLLSAACLVLGESATDELRSGSTARLARRLVTTFARCLSVLQSRSGALYAPQRGESLAAIALHSLGAEPDAASLAAVNALLIACADQELSPSTYAVRIVASTGAGLHACLSAGISAHSGHRLGGSVDRLEDLISCSSSAADLGAKLRHNGRGLSSAPFLPYEHGDPRGLFLMKLAEGVDPHGRLRPLRELVASTQPEAIERPTLELGLVAVARALKLPRRAPGLLWVLGRSAGWVAHVIEQRLLASVIRPRARFGAP
jgi:citrate synthase